MLPLNDTNFSDLLKIVADAPDRRHGALATACLARDVVARLEAITNRDYDAAHRSGAAAVSQHFAYEHVLAATGLDVPKALAAIATPSLVDDPDAALVAVPSGPQIARLYWAWCRSVVPSAGVGYVAMSSPSTSLPVGGTNYSNAGLVIAAVRAGMGDAAFESTRYGVRGIGAPSGGIFALTEIHTGPVISYGIALPSAGDWRVQFTGDVLSRSTANPATVTIELALDGVTAATHSLSRTTPPDPPFPAAKRLGEVVSFDTSDLLTIAGPKTLTIRNGAAAEQSVVGGVIRFWKES